jgi:predicted Zn-dependent protease
MVEAEAMSLLAACERHLGSEAKGFRMSKAVLEEGLSEVEIQSTTGVRAGYRTRTVSIFLQALDAKGGAEASILIAERDARRLRPATLASRLANRLTVAERGKGVERDRGEMVLSPGVGVAVLRGLMPMLLDVGGFEAAKGLRDRGGRVGSESLSIVDHGRLETGVLAAPVDGEGRPTGETKLVKSGVYRQPLLTWSDARRHHLRSSGSMRRDSWRELPALAPSHLYIRPRSEVSARSLIEQVARGFYLLAAESPGVFDLGEDHFQLPVCGFSLRRGRASSPIANCVLSGKVSALLRGIQATGRDLDFEPLGGMLGSPSLLLSGLELKGV